MIIIDNNNNNNTHRRTCVAVSTSRTLKRRVELQNERLGVDAVAAVEMSPAVDQTGVVFFFFLLCLLLL